MRRDEAHLSADHTAALMFDVALHANASATLGIRLTSLALELRIVPNRALRGVA